MEAKGTIQGRVYSRDGGYADMGPSGHRGDLDLNVSDGIRFHKHAAECDHGEQKGWCVTCAEKHEDARLARPLPTVVGSPASKVA